jgi:flavin reductase (DIM6/NTAB) family NADH-FMN oxidoreductase RutF
MTVILPDQLSPTALRDVFSAVPTGVAFVAAVVDGKPEGVLVGSFASVSLDPPLASFCVATTSRTWPLLRTTTDVGISILASGHGEIGRQLGSRDGDRFAHLRWDRVGSHGVRLDDSAAWLVCTNEREIDAGDHHIVLLRVRDHGTAPHVDPLIFHRRRFRGLAR